MDQVGDWITALRDTFGSRLRMVPHATLIDWKTELYYFENIDNYLITQGFTVCLELYQLVSTYELGPKRGDKIRNNFVAEATETEYEYNRDAFGGAGGSCFFIDARKEVSDKIL